MTSQQAMPPRGLMAVAAISTLGILLACAAPSSSGAPSDPASEPLPTATAKQEPTPRALPSPEAPTVALIATGNGPYSLAASADTIWLELHREDKVARVDPVANLQAEVLDVPVHCYLATTATSVWTTIAKRNLVTRFDPISGEALQEFRVANACGIVANGTEIWVTSPSEGAVYVFSEGDPEPINRYEVGAMPFGIALDPASAWVSGEADGGTVWRVDRVTGEVTTIGRFEGADGVVVAFDAVWVTARPSSHLWKLDPADGSILGAIDILNPSGSAASGDTLWVVSQGGALTGLDPTTLGVAYSDKLQYAFLGPPIYAFESLWTAALEQNVLLRVDPPL